MYLQVVLESVMGIWELIGHRSDIGLHFDEASMVITVVGKIFIDELAFVDNVDRAFLGPCSHPHEVAKTVSLATECESIEHCKSS
jgi:hypothetical protein